MGMYKYLSKTWQDSKKELVPVLRERMIGWRKQPVVVKIEKPTRIDKARMLGYKAKQGFIVVRARVEKGGRKRRSIPKGRKPTGYGMHYSPTQNLQARAESRTNRKFPNLEVLNSYYVGDDSKSVWYEIILLDKNHPAIIKDKDVNWIKNHKGRIFRGLTSAARRSSNSRRKLR